MCSQHYDLASFVRAGNFRDRVVLERIVVVKPVGHIELDRDILVLLEQSFDPRPVLDCEHKLRDRSRFSRFVRSSRLHKQGAAAGGAATVIEYGENLFLREELVQILGKLLALEKLGVIEWRMLARNLILANLLELLVTEAMEGSFGNRFYLGIRSEEHDPSRQLAPILVEVFFLGDVDANAFAGNRAVRSRGPGLGVGKERCHIR